MVYKLIKRYTVTEDGDGAETYGVSVFEGDKEEERIYCNADVTFEKEEMQEYISLWNELQPSIPQLKNLIEDIIDAAYSID